MMLLTTCAACAKPIDHDASSRCVACETRYCSDRCQRYDRRRGGHGKICGAIASGGGVEQHYANKKYEEAAAEADEECTQEEEEAFAEMQIIERMDANHAAKAAADEVVGDASQSDWEEGEGMSGSEDDDDDGLDFGEKPKRKRRRSGRRTRVTRGPSGPASVGEELVYV